jgi:hypothetical protein
MDERPSTAKKVTRENGDYARGGLVGHAIVRRAMTPE